MKYKSAQLLEIESGSNDPFAYVLTVKVLSSTSNIAYILLKQVIILLIIDILPKITSYLLNKVKNIDISFFNYSLVAMVLLAFSLSEYLGGMDISFIYMEF